MGFLNIRLFFKISLFMLRRYRWGYQDWLIFLMKTFIFHFRVGLVWRSTKFLIDGALLQSRRPFYFLDQGRIFKKIRPNFSRVWFFTFFVANPFEGQGGSFLIMHIFSWLRSGAFLLSRWLLKDQPQDLEQFLFLITLI